MITRKTVKAVVKLFVIVGTAKITKDVINNNINPPKSPADKAAVVAASMAVGGVVSVAAEKYADETIDYVANTLNDIKQTLNPK